MKQDQKTCCICNGLTLESRVSESMIGEEDHRFVKRFQVQCVTNVSGEMALGYKMTALLPFGCL